MQEQNKDSHPEFVPEIRCCFTFVNDVSTGEIMLLYNVTITVDLAVHDDWLRWMREQHIPDVLATGFFRGYRMSRLLNHEHPESAIYTIQYEVDNWEQLRRYWEECAPRLQGEHLRRYADKCVAFRTVMEVVSAQSNA